MSALIKQSFRKNSVFSNLKQFENISFAWFGSVRIDLVLFCLVCQLLISHTHTHNTQHISVKLDYQMTTLQKQ